MISILMPAKNAESFLEECLQSILSQTYNHWELIIVNDHSSDQSKLLIHQYANKDPRITYYENEGVGIIKALQLAYRHAQGQYITRMDADDIMNPGKLEKMRTRLEKSGQLHVAVGLVSYFSKSDLGQGYMKYEKWLNRLTIHGRNFTEIYKECVIPSPNWMMYRGDFDLCGAFNSGIYPEDYDLCFRMLEAGMTLAPVPEVTHLWRDHPNRASRTLSYYLDNRFSSIKVKYFKKLHHHSNRKLFLLGAGPKGKSIAKELINSGLTFQWVTNNPNKIGHSIYGVIIENQIILEDIDEIQLIVAISSPKEKDSIDLYVKNKGWSLNKEYFPFC